MEETILYNAYKQYTEEEPLLHGYSRRTVEARKGYISKFLLYIKDQSLTLENTQKYILNQAKRGLKSSSVRCIAKNIKAFLRFCYKKHILSENWIADIVVPKFHKEPPVFLDVSTCENIIEIGTEPGKDDLEWHKRVKTEVRLALKLMLRTGLRVKELLTIKGSDLQLINDPPQILIKGKGGDVDFVAVPLDLLPDLKARQDRKKVFEITRECMNRSLKRGAGILGIKVNLHCHLLRHAFGSYHAKTQTPFVLQRLMRHKDISTTTETYVHFALSDIAQALNTMSIIQDGLTPKQVFDFIEKQIKGAGVEKDKRFQLSVAKSDKRMVITVEKVI